MEQIWKNNRILRALALSSLASVVIFLIGVIFYSDTFFWFLIWNLLLAWLPLVFAYMLVLHLKKKPWHDWTGIVLSLLWLGFLPNSFYIGSDFVHIRFATSQTALYYAMLLLSFTLNGLALGFISLYMLHKQALKRVSIETAHTMVAVILLLSSFAIYLGRYLRWNTWDVLINPAGLLFDVSDRLINPAAHEQTFRITVVIFIFLASTYALIWELDHSIRGSKDR